MRKNTRIRFRKDLIAVAIVFCLMIFSGCGAYDVWSPDVDNDAVGLDIQLDTEEDIGLLLVEYDVNGTDGRGGIGNADKSMLAHDDRLFYTFSPESGKPGSAADVSVRFSVVTEACEPNMEEVYPPEITEPLDPISRSAVLGEYYSVTISGDKTNGYEAVWEE